MMPRTLNKITREDYLRAEGAQMLIRILCDEFGGNETDAYFSKRNADGIYERAKYTPYQWLDAIRRFGSGVLTMDEYLNQKDNIKWCPVFGRDKKGKLTVERIDIKRKTDD